MGPRRSAFWPAVFAVLLVVLPGSKQASTEEGRCVVDARTSLEQCLRDAQARLVLISQDHAVGSDFAMYADKPLPINRNVTIAGPPGRGPDTWPVLDLNYADGVVQLCGSCQVQLQDLVVRRERRGSGLAYDMFSGLPGASLACHNVYRLREACSPPDYQLPGIQGLKRSAAFGNATAPQQAVVRSIRYRGREFPTSVWVEDVSHDVPNAVVQEGSESLSGGYALHSQQTARLCAAYVSRDCLKRTSADACIVEMIDGVHAGSHDSASGLTTAAKAGVAAGVVAGVLTAAAALSCLLVARYRRRRREQQDDPEATHGKSRSRPATRTTGHDSCGTHTTGGSSDDAGPRLNRPLALGKGWEVVSSHTSPLIAQVDDCGIELGELIGIGSFGKVFKATWNHSQVAVKIIEHGGDALDAVQHEMELMMGLCHANIIGAYHCLTYTHEMAASSGGGEQYQDLSWQGSSAVTSSLLFGPLSRQPSAAVPPQSCGSFKSGGNAQGSLGSLPSGGAAALHAQWSSDSAAATAADPAAACGAATMLPPAAVGAAVSSSSAGSERLRHYPSLDSSTLAGSSLAEADVAPHPDQAPELAALQQQLRQQQQQHKAPSAAGCSPPPGGGSVSRQGSLHVARQGSANSSRLATSGISDSLTATSVDCKCHAVVAGRSGGASSGPKKAEGGGMGRRYESWLVLEFADCGSLGTFLGRWQPPASCQGGGCMDTAMLRLLYLLQDAAQGLAELHRQHIVHGDLNARNVLCASAPETRLGVRGKLTDLGLARSIRQHRTHRTTNSVGTMSHTSPEMFRSGHMSAAADIYSLGIMMWELFTGSDAFDKLQHPGQFFEAVVLQDLRPIIPAGMPPAYQVLMQHCWAADASARPGVERVLECLAYMISEHEQHLAAADACALGMASALPSPSAPMPALLACAPQRAKPAHWWQQPQHLLHRPAPLVRLLGSESSGAAAACASVGSLPCGALNSGPLLTSSVLLPVLDLEQPDRPPSILRDQFMQLSAFDEAADDAEPGPAAAPTPAPRRTASGLAPAAAATGTACSGAASQPLPSIGGQRRGLGLLGPRRSSADARGGRPHTPTPDSSRTSVDGSTSQKSGAVKLPFLTAVRQGSFSLWELSFSSSRGTSWSQRQGSQTGSVNEHNWFV